MLLEPVKPETMMTLLEWCTFVLAVWAALGPLFGVWFGQKLARKNVRAQWVADSKKKEFKELLSALDAARLALANHAHYRSKQPEDVRALAEAQGNASRCIDDRLFILPEMKRLNVHDRWIAATGTFWEKLDILTFLRCYDEIRREIIKATTEDL